MIIPFGLSRFGNGTSVTEWTGFFYFFAAWERRVVRKLVRNSRQSRPGMAREPAEVKRVCRHHLRVHSELADRDREYRGKEPVEQQRGRCTPARGLGL